MLLQTVRPNIVQSIRAYRVEDLLQAAQDVGQHFLYANLTTAQSKQDVLDSIAASFHFPETCSSRSQRKTVSTRDAFGGHATKVANARKTDVG